MGKRGRSRKRETKTINRKKYGERSRLRAKRGPKGKDPKEHYEKKGKSNAGGEQTSQNQESFGGYVEQERGVKTTSIQEIKRSKKC